MGDETLIQVGPPKPTWSIRPLNNGMCLGVNSRAIYSATATSQTGVYQHVKPVTKPGDPGNADITLYGLPPEYMVKQLVPPPPLEQLYWPTTWGPNATGSVNGILLTPAMVTSVAGPGDRIAVAGVKFSLNTGDLSSEVAIGILPFKESK